jgi:hypothetical protein
MPRIKLAGVPLAALQKEILRRQSLLTKLIAQREDLDRQIAELGAIDAGPALAVDRRMPVKRRVPGARGRRAKNTMSLPDALAEALKGQKPLGIAEAMEAVLGAGYRTASKSFKSIVNRTLIKDKRFKRAGRGKYALKG